MDRSDLVEAKLLAILLLVEVDDGAGACTGAGAAR